MRAFLLAAVAALTLGSAAPSTYAAAGGPASEAQMGGRGHHHHAHRGHGRFGPRNYGRGYYSPYYYAPNAYGPYDWMRPYGFTPSYAPAWSSGYISPSYAPGDWAQGFVSPSVPLGVVPLADPPPPAEAAPAPVCTPRYDVPTGILVDCP